MKDDPPLPSLRASFTKSQISAVLATSVDFLVYLLLVEFAGMWYVTSAAISALCGAMLAFLLGRHWSFKATDGCMYMQGSRFFAVSGLSIVLNTSFVFLLTDGLGMHYFASKVFAALLVGVFINFPLQRHYVFR